MIRLLPPRRAAAALALLLGACSLPQPRSTVQITYTLQASPVQREFVVAQRPVIRILPIDPAPGLGSSAMLYSPAPGQLLAYRDSRWLAPPAELIRAAMARSLARQSWVAAVEQDSSLGAGGLTLHCSLDRLEHDVDVQPGRVRLELECELSRSGTPGVLASWFAAGQTTLERNDAAHYAGAVQSLLDAATATVVQHVGEAAAS